MRATVYTIIVIGSVIGHTVVCVIAWPCCLEWRHAGFHEEVLSCLVKREHSLELLPGSELPERCSSPPCAETSLLQP